MNKFTIARTFDGLLKPGVRQAHQILEFGDKAAPEALQRFRDQSFKDLIGFVYTYVPYYRDVMDGLKMKPADVQGLRDISHFPVLTKDIIRQENGRLRPSSLHPGSYVVRRSGGTTGEPIASYIDSRAAALETYSYFRGLQWMGWRPTYKRVLLSGGSLGLRNVTSWRFKMKSYATGIIMLPAFELASHNIDKYVQEIKKNGPCIITGYASVLKYLSDLCHEKGVVFTNVRQVFSTAEMLPEAWLSPINTTFQCQVKSYYGCGELNSLGFQTEQGGNYLVPDEHVHIESVTNMPGLEDNTLLVTSLFNKAQPLIRYMNGDMGTLAEGNANFKRMTITSLLGRTSDMFTRKDGTKLSSAFGSHSIFMGGIQVKKYQYIQKSLSDIEFRYDPLHDDITAEERGKVVQMVRKIMGDDVNVVFNRTSEFILSKNNKHRIMICEI